MYPNSFPIKPNISRVYVSINILDQVKYCQVYFVGLLIIMKLFPVYIFDKCNLKQWENVNVNYN